jgi:hypothetical protein
MAMEPLVPGSPGGGVMLRELMPIILSHERMGIKARGARGVW